MVDRNITNLVNDTESAELSTTSELALGISIQSAKTTDVFWVGPNKGAQIPVSGVVDYEWLVDGGGIKPGGITKSEVLVQFGSAAPVRATIGPDKLGSFPWSYEGSVAVAGGLTITAYVNLTYYVVTSINQTGNNAYPIRYMRKGMR